MFLRQLRWIVAGLAIVACVVVSPARSRADVQILVEELDASKNVVASQITSGTGTVVPFAFSTGSFFSGGGSVTTVNGLAASLSPSFSGLFNSNYVASQDHSIRITVTNDGFTTGGTGMLLNNDSGASQAGFTGGQITVSTFSRIYDPTAAGSLPASGSVLADGTTLYGPTTISTTIGGGNGPTTTAAVGSLPTPYAIQQQILISFTGSPNAGGTFTAGGGARVEASTQGGSATPAPAGLALGLIALPLLGLRRALRKPAAA